MKKSDFLLTSFTKALNKPKTATFKDYVLCCKNSESGFIFSSREVYDFSPIFIKESVTQSLAQKLVHDKNHNSAFKEELDVFNHYYTENIIVPEDSKEAVEFRQKYKLNSISRQSAQIKCLLATLIPSDFAQKTEKIKQEYSDLIKRIEQCKAENSNAEEIIKILDFSFYYKKIDKKFDFLDLLFPNNKNRLRGRLGDSIQKLINGRTLPADFADGDCFKKPPFSGKLGEKYRMKYVNALLYLSGKILLMRNNQKLLKLALLQVQNSSEFASKLRLFRNANYSPNFHNMLKIKRSAQQFYEKFVKICYLNAVRASFEIFCATENQPSQNPPLPSVAPDKEMKTIALIVEKSFKIKADKGRLSHEYHKAISEYEKCKNILIQLLNTCQKKKLPS